MFIGNLKLIGSQPRRSVSLHKKGCPREVFDPVIFPYADYAFAKPAFLQRAYQYQPLIEPASLLSGTRAEGQQKSFRIHTLQDNDQDMSGVD
tara:strand:- start:24 stop:299 length:276 start_codon:yes stop_codon:yes gene_type:complete